MVSCNSSTFCTSNNEIRKAFMTRRELLAGRQFKLTTSSWHLKITVAQLKVILYVTRGYYRFGSDRLGFERGDKERLQIMKKVAVDGGLRVSHVETHTGHHRFYFFFDRDCTDSTGKNLRGDYCISQWENSTPDFAPSSTPELAGYTRPRVYKKIPTFNAKTNWLWLKRFLNLK